MTRQIPSFTAIGSCRIANPLRQASASGAIHLNSDRIYGYTHSSAEAVQQALYLHGDVEIPELARPLVMPSVDGLSQGEVRHRPSDIYVVEISSAKEVRIENTLVQLNYVTRHFRDFFSDVERTRTFWRLATGERETEKMMFLAGEEAFQDLDDADRERLARLTARPVTGAALLTDIIFLKRRLGNVAFVTHCNAVTNAGRPLISRSRFIAQLKAILSKAKVPFCDPTTAMTAFGQDRAMLDQSGSLSHYTPEFEAHLFQTWWQEMFEPMLAPRLMSESA